MKKEYIKGFDGLNLESMSLDEILNRQTCLLSIIEKLNARVNVQDLVFTLLNDVVACLDIASRREQEING